MTGRTTTSLNGRRRVVITGLGAVTPLGNDVETTWTNLISGRSGAGPITQFDSTGFPVTFACEVKDFDPTDWIDRKQARRMDRFAHLRARGAPGRPSRILGSTSPEPDRIGAAVATGIGGLQSFQDCRDELLDRGPARVNPFSIPEIIPNMGAAWVSMELGTRGPLSSQCTACAASNMSDRRRDGRDPPRPRRRHVLRRHRGAGDGGRHRRLLGDARALAAQRRPGAGEPALRRRPRRVRDGRGGGVLVLEELEHAKGPRREDLR